MDEEEAQRLSLEQRRSALRAELARQRALVAGRLAPPPRPMGGEPARGMGAALEDALEHGDPAYPRSITMRLARKHPALAAGVVALGAALLLRKRGNEVNTMLSIAKYVEPFFEE